MFLEPEHDAQIYTLMTQFTFFEFILEVNCNQEHPEMLLAHQVNLFYNFSLIYNNNSMQVVIVVVCFLVVAQGC